MKLLVLIFVVGSVCGDLKLDGVKCGVLKCQEHQYCSGYDHQCKSCEEICNSKNHNFDENLCVKDCQDYLHDVKYVRIGNSGSDRTISSGTDLVDEVNRLYKLATTSLALVVILIVILIGVVIYHFCYVKKNNNELCVFNFKKYFSKKNNEPTENKAANNGVYNISGKPDFVLPVPTPESISETPRTLTSSTRRPAEDSALDYAYDNKAMSTVSTPPIHIERETNF